MLDRFRRIQSEFGTIALVRTLILFVGLIGLTLFDFFAFSSIWAGGITIVGLAVGFLLREKIAEGVEHYPRLVSAGLFVYPFVLFFGERLGLGHNERLAIITGITVVLFGLQFWSLSDPSVVNAEGERVE